MPPRGGARASFSCRGYQMGKKEMKRIWFSRMAAAGLSALFLVLLLSGCSGSASLSMAEAPKAPLVAGSFAASEEDPEVAVPQELRNNIWINA